MRERVKAWPCPDVVSSFKQSPKFGVAMARMHTDAFLQTGRDLYMTAVLGPGCRLDKRLRGIGVRR